MNIVLDDWQKEVLASKGNILLCTGRQVGKTMIMARKAAERMIRVANSKIIVVSLTEDQAELIIVFVLNHLEQKHKHLLAKPISKNVTKRKIKLTNGSYVLARPVGNTGDAVRGFTGDVLIVDEASRMPELMWAAAKPTLATTGGEIWMCSTPFGKQGYFYKCYLNKDSRFWVKHVNTPDVYKERTWSSEQIKEDALEFLEDEEKDMTTLEFGQEYGGRFLEDVMQFFPDDLITERMNMEKPETIARHRTHYLGVDIGRMGEDPSTFEIFRRSGDRMVQVDNQITKKTLLTQTSGKILDLNTQYDFKEIFVDDEGIGVGVFDILISDDRTKRKTQGLKNSKKVIDYKNDKKTRMLEVDLYMNTLRLMELRMVDFLKDDSIRLSLKSVQYEYTTDKKGKPFMHFFGNDRHIIEGINRALWCVKGKDINRLIFSFKP